ncbi:DegT/DnrJ/EryC1/StrS aminotransferase family protein [Dickeya chrysanthemi]|uniref:DegT/DnrJ/EryC1/StrS family aminotransferase n=1 Tax=Dickeya chrysanthemi TaxID=556 RepID=UPI003017B7AD
MSIIPVYQPSLNGREKEYVMKCLDSTWISSRGEFISEFEKAFATYAGCEYATTVANGTVALHLALEALGIGAGDEVIVPTLTYIASVNTIVQTGASVVYCESNAETWNVDVEDLRKRISPRTKAVMVVHLYGLACDMDAVLTLCKEHNLFLIEDCAEAFGSRFNGKHVGTFGDVATFSFFGNKTITTGEGGMVLCREHEIYERACHLKSQGVSKTREYWHDVLAYNYRMTNICAAIGLAQLEQADDIIARKREIAALYTKELKGLPLHLQPEPEGYFHTYWMCSILLDRADDRSGLRAHLKEIGVETRPLFPPAHTMPHVFSNEKFPVAESLSGRGINLPSYPGITDEQVIFICNSIKAYFHQ